MCFDSGVMHFGGGAMCFDSGVMHFGGGVCVLIMWHDLIWSV